MNDERSFEDVRVEVILEGDPHCYCGYLIGYVDLNTDADWQAREKLRAEEGNEGDEFRDFIEFVEQATDEQLENVVAFIEEDEAQHPKIRLDDNRIVFGCDCEWWGPLPKEREVALMKALQTARLN